MLPLPESPLRDSSFKAMRGVEVDRGRNVDGTCDDVDVDVEGEGDTGKWTRIPLSSLTARLMPGKWVKGRVRAQLVYSYVSEEEVLESKDITASHKSKSLPESRKKSK